MSDPDWTALASAILAEVGLTFDDVLDIGRDWVIGPPGLETQIAEPTPHATVYPCFPGNPTARSRPLIAITGPIDDERMLHMLAHECGHIACKAWTSEPEYVHEFRAERYANAAILRHLGRDPSPEIVESGKAYVRAHCEGRFQIMGASPTKRWRRDVVEWCGFEPPEPLDFYP